LILLAASACQALTGADDVATLDAAMIAYQTEAVNLDFAATAEHIYARETVSVNETELAINNAINQQLLATLVRQITPTPQLVGEDGPDDWQLVVGVESGGQTSQNPGEQSFVLTGLSTSVRQDDGCVISPQASFRTDVSRVYATFIAYMLTPGVVLRAEWYQEGELVSDASWTSDGEYDQLCIWFYIDPSDAAFIPGSWSVRLYADQQPIGGTVSFVFANPDEMMDG
jgi:hypothetical protein